MIVGKSWSNCYSEMQFGIDGNSFRLVRSFKCWAIFQAKLGEKSIGGYFLLFLIFFWGVSLTFRFTKSSLIYITVHYGWYFGIPSFVHSQSLDSKSSCYLVPSLSYLLHSFTIRIYTVPPFGRHYIYSHACSQ